MSLSELITTGRQMSPLRVIVYGGAGIGKSTWASKSNKPLFVQTERGSDQLDVARLPLCKSFDQLTEQLRAVYAEEHPYKTLVIDSVDGVEKLIHEALCQQYSAESITDTKVKAFGYGGGLNFAERMMRTVVDMLDHIHGQGVNIVIIGHNEIAKYKDPGLETYDRHQIKLEKKASAVITEWADCVLFATRNVYVTEMDDKRAKATSDGKRVLRTTEAPSYVAKNRYSLPDPISMDTWEDFANPIKQFFNEGEKNNG